MKSMIVGLILTVTSAAAADWKKEVVFRATFDGGTDAKVAGGDPHLYHARSYNDLSDAKPGLEGTSITLAKGQGRKGDALKFTKPNELAVFYKAQGNVPFSAKDWSGTLSLWLQLDVEMDLPPNYCDPIQLTDKAYNDCAIWVDFTKDDKPRHFRLGTFGSLKAWNPSNSNPDANPLFNNRLVVVKQPPFGRGRWTHVAVTYNKLGSGDGEVKLYVDGALQGASSHIAESFDWDLSKAGIRLAFNYVGLMDDIAVFRRPLTAKEIAAIGKATSW